MRLFGRSRSRSASPSDNEKKQMNKNAKKMFDDIEGYKHILMNKEPSEIIEKRFFTYHSVVFENIKNIDDSLWKQH